MHLFKNKTKDVKQFLEEMKANKTNRSSNPTTLEKQHKTHPTNSPEPYHSQYHPNHFTTSRTLPYQNSLHNGPINVSNQDSNSNFRASVVSNPRSIITPGHRFTPIPPQPVISNQQRAPQEQNFYKEKSLRPTYNERSDYQDTQVFGFNPPSEPIYRDYLEVTQTNRTKNPFQPTRSFAQYEKPQQKHFNPYHSEVKQGYSQNNRSFNEFPQQRLKIDLQPNMSQRSNSIIYEEAQFYQNSNFMPHPQRNSQVQRPESVSFSTHNLSQKIESSSNKYDIQSSRNEVQNPRTYLNKQESQKLYTSQISNADYQMAEISQAEDGLSTQKGSPTKLSDFLSKTKYDFVEIQQIPNNKNYVERKLLKISQSKKMVTPQINQIKQQKNSQLKVQKKASPIKMKPKISNIKISQNQKYRLQKSLHQVDQVHLKLDAVLKQASVLLNNIKRSDQNFKKLILNHRILQKTNRDNQQTGISPTYNLRMQIEGQPVKMMAKDAPTDKKIKPKMEKKFEAEMNVKHTFKKSSGYYKEVEI